ncbi:SLBB domain-containing protein [Larkinella punicea]|uniref:Sugar transporter n=1 Tax=Larkinella punicea TaxID=2315727 RepID=A0A368JIK9_9BACT|nr:SLBB domain-containing protein [Larkinella punicea]RCR67135.1 sugar transporter [Larkinella punicea]
MMAFGVLTSSVAQKVADLTEEQVQQFIQQAKSSGLSEVQIEQLALSRGFTQADITKMRQRVSDLNTVPKSEPVREPTGGRTQSEDSPVPVPPPVAVLTPPTSETTLLTPTVFGASLFTNANLTFEPNLRIPTPKNYQLGPDDELIVDIFGNAQQTYRTRINPEGTIRLENLSPISVNGLTMEQAEQRIVTRLRQLYAGLNTPGSGIQAQVSLGNIRSIKVTLIGQVVKPGTYTLSSLGTVFNALYAAGGPDPGRGSFRDIRVYRANRQIRTLDIYDFLLGADQKDNIRLQDQDIIFVNHYDTRVALTGEVKQPGLYEVKKGEMLKTVLAFAGGFTDRAYTASLTLRRNTPKELEIGTIPATAIDAFVPQRGDQYVVGSITDRFSNRVVVSGAVFRPGTYALQNNATLKQLITSAEGLREDAFLNRATIRRLRKNLDPELISVDLGKLMRGETTDIPLQREDNVTVLAYSDLREKRTIALQGAVNKPGTFDYADSMSVANLIVLAGGFTEGATASRIEIARRIRNDSTGLPNNQNVRLFQFNLDENLRLNEADAHFSLQPFDEVFVRTSPRYEQQKMVTITGEVTYPGRYAIRDKSERISDLIDRAGGLQTSAFLKATRFIRKEELISIDIHQILQRPTDSGNLLLLAGDSIVIPRKVELVRIRGEVLNPSTVDFNQAKSFRSYINESGGFTSKAQRRKSYAIYANGQIRRTKQLLFFRSFPKPDPGMELVVPSKPKREESKLSPAERVAVMTGITSLAAVVLTIIRLF